MDWRNLIKQSVTVGAQLLWGGRYGCNNGHYGCTIVMSHIEINKAVSQWLLTFNLCVSVTWTLTCAFHIPCTHTPEIIDMHRGVCDIVGGLCACWNEMKIPYCLRGIMSDDENKITIKSNKQEDIFWFKFIHWIFIPRVQLTVFMQYFK